MPDPVAPPPAGPPADPPPEATPPRAAGLSWPLWVRILLAAVLLGFVWSPFWTMLMRLSQVAPSLQPTGGNTELAPPSSQGTPGTSTPRP